MASEVVETNDGRVDVVVVVRIWLLVLLSSIVEDVDIDNVSNEEENDRLVLLVVSLVSLKEVSLVVVRAKDVESKDEDSKVDVVVAVAVDDVCEIGVDVDISEELVAMDEVELVELMTFS